MNTTSLSIFEIASLLITSEGLFDSQPDTAMDLYEAAIALVTDENREQVARVLKSVGSKMEVLSSNT